MQGCWVGFRDGAGGERREAGWAIEAVKRLAERGFEMFGRFEEVCNYENNARAEGESASRSVRVARTEIRPNSATHSAPSLSLLVVLSLSTLPSPRRPTLPLLLEPS